MVESLEDARRQAAKSIASAKATHEVEEVRRRAEVEAQTKRLTDAVHSFVVATAKFDTTDSARVLLGKRAIRTERRGRFGRRVTGVDERWTTGWIVASQSHEEYYYLDVHGNWWDKHGDRGEPVELRSLLERHRGNVNELGNEVIRTLGGLLAGLEARR